MDPDDLELLDQSLQRATHARSGEPLEAALAEIGWVDALGAEPRAAVASLFNHQGHAAASSRALSTVVASALGLDRDSVVLLPPLGSTAPPASIAADDRPVVAGVALGGSADSSHMIVVGAREGETVAASVPTRDLAIRVARGIDPRLCLLDVSGELPSRAWTPTSGAWSDAVAAAQRAVGHELVGAMRAMLELARVHALDRVQFDRPISSFQAVRHRLAESLVAIESADAALDGAWVDGTPFAATVAKAVTGHSAAVVRRHCQQVLAGIGFTTEHDLHHFVRRTIVLDQLFGDARMLSERIGADLLASRELPEILPL